MVVVSEQDHNPYATITETRTKILEQMEKIKFLLRALHDVCFHHSTITPISDGILSILLSNDYYDDDDYDDNVDYVEDLGRLHSLTIARFDVDDDDNEDGDDNYDKD